MSSENQINTIQAINWALDDAMAKHSNVILFGEEVADPGVEPVDGKEQLLHDGPAGCSAGRCENRGDRGRESRSGAGPRGPGAGGAVLPQDFFPAWAPK